MIKKILKMFIIVITILMILSTIYLHDPLLPFKFGKYIFTYKYANYTINKECDAIERENREENLNAAKKYICEKYGSILSEIIEIEYIGRRKDWSSNSHYKLYIPFCDPGELSVESENHNVYGGFDFVNSPKFQHLYSNWVKKQVGIEDENVELEFSEAKLGSRLVSEKPYIAFDKISTYDNLEEQICTNTHNLYIRSNTYGYPGITINVKNDIIIHEVLAYIEKLVEKVKSKIFIYEGFDKHNRENKIFINVVNNEKLILAICYNFDQNTKEYIDYRINNEKWIKYE